MEIQTFVVEHGPSPVVGIRVADFAYITDVSRIPPDVEERLAGLDTLIIDAVRIKPHPNHLHLDGALEEIEILAPRRAYLTHLSHDYDHAVTEKELPENVKLAYDGMRLSLADG